MLSVEDILERAVRERTVVLDSQTKNNALMCMAEALLEYEADILTANAADVADARQRLSDSMIDRLTLTSERIRSMAQGIQDVAALPDPVGRVLKKTVRDDGLTIERVSVPFGVVAIIYESRPNVTSDAAALAVKSGNVCVLRSGRDAMRSAAAIVGAMRTGLGKAGVCPDRISLVEESSREGANALMTAKGKVDLLIPRGGAGLIRSCVEHASVPVIETGTGICHIYVDESADIDMAIDIIENAKCSRPSVCNAEEVLLVHSSIAERLLPALSIRLRDDRVAAGLTPVEFRLDKRAAQYVYGTAAGPDDFDTEFLDYILAVGIVDSTREAVEHIAAHSTHHSEAIVSNDSESIALFQSAVDSAAVYVNASTRFTDGGQFGLGCEMGISTQKLHARGPMGLEELTTYKYLITGKGQVRK